MRSKKSGATPDVVGGLAPPAEKRIGAGDEAALASNVRLMAERLGLKSIKLHRDARVFALDGLDKEDRSVRYDSTETDDRDALLDLHEKLRADLLDRIALDHDVLTRVRGTHAIRRRRDAEWYAAQRRVQRT